MATVYRAFDTNLERDVAVKVIRREASARIFRSMLKRFDREAKTLAKLTHPNIVSIIDYGNYEGSHTWSCPIYRRYSEKSRGQTLALAENCQIAQANCLRPGLRPYPGSDPPRRQTRQHPHHRQRRTRAYRFPTRAQNSRRRGKPSPAPGWVSAHLNTWLRNRGWVKRSMPARIFTL